MYVHIGIDTDAHVVQATKRKQLSLPLSYMYHTHNDNAFIVSCTLLHCGVLDRRYEEQGKKKAENKKNGGR